MKNCSTGEEPETLKDITNWTCECNCVTFDDGLCRIVQTTPPVINITCPELQECPKCPACKDTDCLDKMAEAQREITRMRELLKQNGVD